MRHPRHSHNNVVKPVQRTANHFSITILNVSRWTSKGGSYRTIQRFFNTVLPWTTMYWTFFRTHLLDHESVFILAGDEVVRSKHGKYTHGLSRFFSH